MVLQLKNLQKNYGDFTAVDTLDLDIKTGELIALLGPSGCGKTTTLQMVAGFTTPTQGRVLLDGCDITHTPAHKRGIGIMFQSYALFPHMTVFENVAFGLQMRKIPKQQIKQQVFKKLELVHLTDHADKYPSALSGGQKQRVALVRALVIEPSLLLLDEPLSALDAKIREDMQNELRRIQQHLNITTVMVTHDQSEALAISDRVAIMNDGKIEQIGSPVDVYARPNTLFVCKFLGRSNIITAKVIGDNRVQIFGTSHSMPVSQTAGQNINIAIRPEHIQLSTDVKNTTAVGTVLQRIFMGGYWVVDVQTPFGVISVVSADTTINTLHTDTQVGLHISLAKATVV